MSSPCFLFFPEPAFLPERNYSLPSIPRVSWPFVNFPTFDLETNSKVLFLSASPASPRYEIVGVDRTVLLLIYLVFMESNANAQIDISCFLWLAKWVNQEKLEYCQNDTAKWMQSSSEFFDWSRKILTSNFAQNLHQCKPMAPQAVLFTCSRLIIQFMTKSPNNMSCVPDVIDAYRVSGLTSCFLLNFDFRIIACLVDIENDFLSAYCCSPTFCIN